MFKKTIKAMCISMLFSLFCIGLTGCSNENNTNSEINYINTPTPTIIPTEELQYEYRVENNMDGIIMVMSEPYKVKFYNTDIDFIDINFKSENLKISLPLSVYNPNKLYELDEDESGRPIILTSDMNKIITNLSDEVHYTTLCYSTGVFSTWSYNIDKETYDNLIFCDAYDVLNLLTNEEQIRYRNGYDFEKHYINKEENAYRINMEIDYHPFDESINKPSSEVFYHGYITFLVKDDVVRVVLFAEPKFDSLAPYQMGYPIISNCSFLDIETKTYSEEEDLEYYIAHVNDTETPTDTPTETPEDTPTSVPTDTPIDVPSEENGESSENKEDIENKEEVENPKEDTTSTSPTPTPKEETLSGEETKNEEKDDTSLSGEKEQTDSLSGSFE